MRGVRDFRAAIQVLAVACCLRTSPSRAEDVPPGSLCPPGPHVRLEPAADLPEALVVEVSTDLAAELSPRGLSLCAPGASSDEPAAVVHLALTEKHALIELDDRTTQKRVARDVRIDRIPVAGRPLAIAIAIDELLRASWAELTMRPAPPAVEPHTDVQVPPEKPEPAPTTRPPRRTQIRLGGALSTLHGLERFHAFGPTVLGDLRHGPWWLRPSLGFRYAVPVRASAGRVNAVGVEAGLAIGLCTEVGAATRLCGGPSLALDALWFRGQARGAVADANELGWLWRAEGVAALSTALGEHLWLGAQLGVGGALRGLAISDGRDTLLAAEGWLFSGQLSLEVSL